MSDIERQVLILNGLSLTW